MANHIWRRDVLKAGIGVTTAAVGATIMGEPNKIFAAPPTQRDGVSAASVERSISMAIRAKADALPVVRTRRYRRDHQQKIAQAVRSALANMF